MADLDLKKYEGSGGITVLNRGGEHLYSYGTEELIKQIEGLSGVADGNWFIGNLSKAAGGKSGFSDSHQTGMDVDIAIPLKGGKSSAKDSNWAKFPAKSHEAFKEIEASPESKKWYSWKKSGKLFKERKESLPGIPDTFKKELEKYTTPPFESSGEMDSYKAAQLMKYFADKGFKLILLNRDLFNNIAYDFHKNLEGGSISPDDELLKFVEENIPNKLSVKKPLLADKKENHGDHFHIRLEGSGRLEDDEDRKAGEDSDSKEREKERKKSKLGRSVFDPDAPGSFKDDFESGGFAGFKEAAQLIHKKGENSDFKRWFVSWLRREMTRAGNEYVDVDGRVQKLTESDKAKIYGNIVKYVDSGFDKKIVLDKTYQFMSFFVKYYNDGGRKDYKIWLGKNKAIPENKRNEMMKITKERLAQIIKEEVEAYRASHEPQVNESIDKETLDILKAVVKQTYQELTIPTDVDQTYADTGEPVSKDPEVMKQKAIEFIMAEVEHILDKELEDEVQVDLEENGHDDIPSAVRAMKTMAEDALEMLDALEQMDGNLPTWWTNKMAVSASMLNKMRDYLLVPSEDEVLDEQ